MNTISSFATPLAVISVWESSMATKHFFNGLACQPLLLGTRLLLQVIALAFSFSIHKLKGLSDAKKDTSKSTLRPAV